MPAYRLCVCRPGRSQHHLHCLRRISCRLRLCPPGAMQFDKIAWPQPASARIEAVGRRISAHGVVPPTSPPLSLRDPLSAPMTDFPNVPVETGDASGASARGMAFKARRALGHLGDHTPCTRHTPCLRTDDLHVGRSSARPGATTEQTKPYSYVLKVKDHRDHRQQAVSESGATSPHRPVHTGRLPQLSGTQWHFPVLGRTANQRSHRRGHWFDPSIAHSQKSSSDVLSGRTFRSLKMAQAARRA
jgi:hypothetical protein